ncbi:MAG: TIGR03545 family protein [Nitrospirae bacterium]|nr:TIGR03545 family protein [Nitrospirota bacterium]
MTDSKDRKDRKDERGEPGKKAQQGKPGWVRWWGLAVFVAVAAASAAFWFVFLDHFVKRMIEQTGTRLVGAKVELVAADVALFPLGLTLTGLQVTDPDEPMTNAVEVARIAMTLDGFNLIRRKVIIEEMALEGLRLGTSRKTSGAVSQQFDKANKGVLEKLAEKVSLPSFEVPDIKTIMAGADLESVKLAESLRAEIQAEQDNWKKRLADLPDKAKLNDYKTRIERLKSSGKGGVGGILGVVGEVAAIQKDLERDLASIQRAKAEFDTKLTSLKQRVDQAVQAPQEDVRRLQEKYSLSPQGLANMSGVLLAGQSGAWVRKGVVWYGKMQPVLARVKERQQGHEVVKPVRGKGVDVRFKEQAPLPDFLIRLSKVSAQLDVGDVSGRIENITPDQDILGLPLTFSFAGEKLKGVQSLHFAGTLNHVLPESATDGDGRSAIGAPDRGQAGFVQPVRQGDRFGPVRCLGVHREGRSHGHARSVRGSPHIRSGRCVERSRGYVGARLCRPFQEGTGDSRHVEGRRPAERTQEQLRWLGRCRG